MVTKIKGRKKFKGVITENGEVVNLDFMVDAFIPRSPKDKTPYVKVYGQRIFDMLRTKKLKASELKVFLWFVSKSSAKNYWANDWINIGYEDIAKDLDLRKETIQRATKKLLKLKLIVQWRPRQLMFRLNPDYCFKGGVVSKAKVIGEDTQLQAQR